MKERKREDVGFKYINFWIRSYAFLLLLLLLLRPSSFLLSLPQVSYTMSCLFPYTQWVAPVPGCIASILYSSITEANFSNMECCISSYCSKKY